MLAHYFNWNLCIGVTPSPTKVVSKSSEVWHPPDWVQLQKRSSPTPVTSIETPKFTFAKRENAMTCIRRRSFVRSLSITKWAGHISQERFDPLSPNFTRTSVLVWSATNRIWRHWLLPAGSYCKKPDENATSVDFWSNFSGMFWATIAKF